MQIRLEFVISDVATRIEEGYVDLIIKRDDGGGFVEFSHSTTRPPLRSVVEKYVFQDSTGDIAWGYQAVPVKSDGTEYPSPYAATLVSINTYTTLQDVRDEGVSDTDVSDERVEQFIEIANRYIERYTQSWFNPRYQVFTITGEDRPRLFLDIPIIAIQRITINDQDEQIGNLEINNRYLRTGMTSPDDRRNPMITYSDGYLVEPGERLYSFGGGEFPRDRQQIKIWGIFGFTELPRGTVCGETQVRSQVPIDYGDVPELIKWCATQIVINRCYPSLSDQSLQLVLKNRIEKMKTRDQEVQFSEQDESEISNTTGFTNSTAVDEILSTFKRPLKMEFV